MMRVQAPQIFFLLEEPPLREVWNVEVAERERSDGGFSYIFFFSHIQLQVCSTNSVFSLHSSVYAALQSARSALGAFERYLLNWLNVSSYKMALQHFRWIVNNRCFLVIKSRKWQYSTEISDNLQTSEVSHLFVTSVHLIISAVRLHRLKFDASIFVGHKERPAKPAGTCITYEICLQWRSLSK